MKSVSIPLLAGSLLFYVLAACTTAPEATASPTLPVPTETEPATATSVPSGQAVVLDLTGEQAVYAFAYDPQDLEAAHLCLWRTGEDATLLDQTDEQVRWFTNAVISADTQQVVYTRYLRQSDLVEIWTVGLDGEHRQRLVSSETFVQLAAGFARAIPQQMLALSNGYVVFNTSEFGYKTDALNDLHLLDLNSGELTTLLPAGQGGQISLTEDGAYVLIARAGDPLALDTSTLQIQAAPPALLTPDSAQAPTATSALPPLQDCAP